jgi:PAS domain S-box-containing protein
MKIKTQVSISLIVFVILAVLISFSVYSSNNQLQEITKKQIIIDEIKMGSFDLYYLENDYILHGGTRPIDQWHSKYNMLSGQLEELTITDPSQQAVFNAMSDNFKNIQTTFSNLLAMTGSVQGTKTSPASQELKEFVTTTLTVQTQTLMFSSSELSKLVRAESLEVQQRNTLITSASLAALIIFVLLNYFVINRSVLRSISVLQKGTEQIGSGDLDTKIETGDNDELGDLSRAFNAMTSNLKTVLTSKSELEKEIAERKRAEEALRETTGYLQNLFDYANAPIITWDPGFRITRFNHAFERLTGRSQEEVLGKTLDILFPDESRQASMALIQKTLEGERWETVEIPILNTDGSKKTVLWNSANLLDPQGKLTATIAQGFDITDRKKAEQELKNYSGKLEEMVNERTRDLREAQDQLIKKEKLAVLGKLAGGVGHELRNPLGAIKNAAYFLDMALEKPDPDVKEMVELINKEVARSEDIISSLLDFARPKTLTLRKGAVNTVINEALKRNPVPKNIAVISNLDETLPEIQADSDKLLQVFNNIISNAFQAMPEGGKLTITSKQSGPGVVSIAFADTGVGISAENMKRLFEPLFTTKIKGIGLGMVVTKTIVESHGGHIDVQSEKGKGTTFIVNLPMSGRKEE